ncbi:MAG: cadherin domain-containing protein, partial [Chloroflexota bacterium]|nr:cadherin domain-containing protein [Chloroflexota bacterium]
GLRLGAQGLSGPVPAALGQLAYLTALDLRGNALTSAVPEALGTLTRLTELHLSGTRLTGCLPAALAGVTTTDAAMQGLAACQAGPAFGAPRYEWIVPTGLPVGAAIGQVQATDPKGGAVTYALTAGNDAGVFQLNATTGILSVAGTLPAGGPGLTIRATDAQGGVTRVPVLVAVADATQRVPPLFPAGGWTFRVAENADVGTAVGTAAARDLDVGPLTYALTAGNTAGAFALDPTSGMLTVAASLNYDTTSTYALTLTATDAHNGTATTTVTVMVTRHPNP